MATPAAIPPQIWILSGGDPEMGSAYGEHEYERTDDEDPVAAQYREDAQVAS